MGFYDYVTSRYASISHHTIWMVESWIVDLWISLNHFWLSLTSTSRPPLLQVMRNFQSKITQSLSRQSSARTFMQAVVLNSWTLNGWTFKLCRYYNKINISINMHIKYKYTCIHNTYKQFFQQNYHKIMWIYHLRTNIKSSPVQCHGSDCYLLAGSCDVHSLQLRSFTFSHCTN